MATIGKMIASFLEKGQRFMRFPYIGQNSRPSKGDKKTHNNGLTHNFKEECLLVRLPKV
jgi:hypothetical protein